MAYKLSIQNQAKINDLKIQLVLIVLPLILKGNIEYVLTLLGTYVFILLTSLFTVLLLSKF